MPIPSIYTTKVYIQKAVNKGVKKPRTKKEKVRSTLTFLHKSSLSIVIYSKS